MASNNQSDPQPAKPEASAKKVTKKAAKKAVVTHRVVAKPAKGRVKQPPGLSIPSLLGPDKDVPGISVPSPSGLVLGSKNEPLTIAIPSLGSSLFGND